MVLGFWVKSTFCMILGKRFGNGVPWGWLFCLGTRIRWLTVLKAGIHAQEDRLEWSVSWLSRFCVVFGVCSSVVVASLLCWALLCFAFLLAVFWLSRLPCFGSVVVSGLFLVRPFGSSVWFYGLPRLLPCFLVGLVWPLASFNIFASSKKKKVNRSNAT